MVERAKVILVVLKDDVDSDAGGEIASAFALFRGVSGVARTEDDGVFEVEIPRAPAESLWEALRRLEIKFEERS